MRISDWSSDVCSSDLQAGCLIYLPVYRTVSPADVEERRRELIGYVYSPFRMGDFMRGLLGDRQRDVGLEIFDGEAPSDNALMYSTDTPSGQRTAGAAPFVDTATLSMAGRIWTLRRSEEHTSELQSLMRISYAVFCLNKKTK